MNVLSKVEDVQYDVSQSECQRGLAAPGNGKMTFLRQDSGMGGASSDSSSSSSEDEEDFELGSELSRMMGLPENKDQRSK